MTIDPSPAVAQPSSRPPVRWRLWLGSIRNKILISFFGITLLTMLSFGAVANYVTRNQTLVDVGQSQQNIADAQARAMADFLSRQVDTLSTFSTQFTDLVTMANSAWSGDPAAIQAEINRRDQQWIAADKANNDADPLVASRLRNDTAEKLRQYRLAFPENVEVFLTDKYGANIAVSNRTSDYNQADEAWWQTTYNNGRGAVYIGDLDYDASSKTFSSDIAVPVYAPGTARVIGVLRTTVTAQSMVDLFSASSQTGKVQSVDLLLPSSAKLLVKGQPTDASPALQATLHSVPRPYSQFLYQGQSSFVSVSPVTSDRPYIKNLGWLVVVSQHSADALAPVNAQFRIILLVALIIAALATLFSFIFARTLSAPVLRLTSTAAKVASGDLSAVAQVDSGDEIGQLASTFNGMTSQLREMIGSLELRVAERTKDLATVAEIGSTTAAILESDRLLQEVVDLTKERFNLYHAHIYLLDPSGQNLTLAAGAGEPGRIMKAQGLSIPLNREQSLVARAARQRKGVIVNDVTLSPDFLPNPLLPDTRSELAVPMLAGGTLIGVFDIQSDRQGRFTDSDVNIQTTLAAQIAAAVQNARSFEQSKKQAELEMLVNTIGQKIQRTTSVEDTLQTAIRELGVATGAARVKVSIQASHPDNGAN
jgi:putative methionine-R-sulfoxide reductase with GAF domain